MLKMLKMKRFLVIALLLVLALCLTACQESSESKYSRANKLLAEAKYDEAVKLFEEISTYEDSSKMTMYGKAIAAAEKGEYKVAISSFQALGDYKDCPMMITYYTARQFEDQATDVNWTPRVMAAETYDTIALFWTAGTGRRITGKLCMTGRCPMRKRNSMLRAWRCWQR